MISRFKKVWPKLPSVNVFRRSAIFTLPAIALSGCLAATAQVVTLRPVSLLVPYLMARATAVDTLISRVNERFDTLHALEKDSISIGGLGEVTWGMTIQEAANAAQVSFVVAPLGQSPSCQYYLPENFDPKKAIRTGSIDGIGLMVVNDQVIRIDIWPGSPIKTSRDIGVGSTIAEVQAAYDGNIEVNAHPYTNGSYLTLNSEAAGTTLYSLVFEADQAGKVTQFRAGQLPAVTWTEGCS